MAILKKITLKAEKYEIVSFADSNETSHGLNASYTNLDKIFKYKYHKS